MSREQDALPAERWVPTGPDNFLKVFSFFPKYGDRFQKPRVTDTALVLDLPWYANLYVPDFYIPVKAGLRTRIEIVNTDFLRYAARKEMPPLSLAIDMDSCIDKTLGSTPRILSIIDRWVLQS